MLVWYQSSEVREHRKRTGRASKAGPTAWRGSGKMVWTWRLSLLHHNRRQLPTCFSVIASPSPKPLSPQARA